jgi:SAM-dependent methyltransferase
MINRAYRDAEGFRLYWANELEQAGARLIQPLALREARRVLDLGAGIGVNVPRLRDAAPSATIVAADFVESMIRAAPPTAARACMDAQSLGFPDETFDAVLMAFMLFHVPDPMRALAEVRRVLRPGGRLAVGAWYASEPAFQPDEIWYAELAAHGADRVPEAIAHHSIMDTPSKLAGLLAGAGFAQIETGDAWFEDPMNDPEEFLTRRTALGSSAARFETLSLKARASCVAAVRAKLAAFAPSDFTSLERAIFAWAVREA